LYGVNTAKSKLDLWIVALNEDRKPEPWLETPFNEALGQFSPITSGGQTLVAYVSDESGALEVYVDSYPQGGGKRLVSRGGGTQPQWRRDGREMFYLAPGGLLMAVDVKTSPQFEMGIPHPLFPASVYLETGPYGPPGPRYAVAPDGNRFLIVSETGTAGQTTPLTVVLNWQRATRASAEAGR
jgi:hypothetical protein